MKFGFVYVVVWLCVADGIEFGRDTQLTEGSKCKTKYGMHGICRLIHDCPLQLHVVGQFPSEFWPIICGFDGLVPYVCCPDESLRPSEQACRRAEDDLISGNLEIIDVRDKLIKTPPVTKNERPRGNVSTSGMRTRSRKRQPQSKTNHPRLSLVNTESNQQQHINKTLLDEVAVGYRKNGTSEWLCGGTLLSDSFVLTAAHCVASTKRPSPNVVWIGAHDLRSESEGLQRGVENYIIHPLYTPTSRYHDIALLKIQRTLMLHIVPACLHSRLDTPQNMSILGWGSTEKDGGGPLSPILQTADLTLVSQHHCNESYASRSHVSSILRHGITGTMICAKGSDGQADACQGDSGGPLQSPRKADSPMYNVVGVTSFGKLCSGTGVYTRVASYLDWIESIIWPVEK